MKPSLQDGQQKKTSIEAVSQVLLKPNTFLHNVGIQQLAAKTNNMQELQAELEAKSKSLRDFNRRLKDWRSRH
jgi:hypothetical protein